MGTIIRKNERSWAIEIISEINIMLSKLDLRIKRVGGESTISVNKKSMFPDVLLYADEAQTKILQGWELKMPDVLITDEEFIKDATRKAKVLDLNSFFIWNFTYGKLYIKNENNEFEEVKIWNGTEHIKYRIDVTTYKNEWLPIIKDVIIEVNEFFVESKINSAPLINVLTDNLMTVIIERNKSLVADNYQIEVTRNMAMERRLKVWWNVFREDYVKDEKDVYSAYAKTILLNWTNRVIFANIIKRYHNCAKLIEGIDNSTSPKDGNDIIDEIIKRGDFYHVFQKLEYNDVIPEDTWIDIVDFNQFLNQNGVRNINQDVLQDLLEKTVNATKREVRGQFATPTWLADLLCQITIEDWNGNCADICSGTGTIAKSIIENKLKRLQNVELTFATTWISDKYAYPLQVSNISLTSIEAINIPVNMFQMNLFELEAGKDIVIKNPIDGTDIHIQFPELDAVVSNLPFVKYNNIATDEIHYINKYSEEIINNTGITFKSGKTDLYMFLPFKIHELLAPKGKLGIILSNSWLGTEVGYNFYKALTYYYELQTVVLSNCGRWFKNADVVATLLIMQKKEIREPDATKKINFCLMENEIKDIKPEEYETVISSIVLKEELNTEIITMKSHSIAEIEDIHNKGICLNALFHDISWVQEIEDKLIPINEIFTVKRGERRGWNDLFYPCERHSIEKDYIKPVLKNPANLLDFKAKTDVIAFCCDKSKNELEELGHTGALKWIEKFENITNGTGKALPIALRRVGSQWYEMDSATKADMVTALNPNKRLFVAKFDEPTFVDQRFTRLLVKDKGIQLELSHALLNSIYGMFAIEAMGFGRGLGVLDASSTNFKKIYMVNPKQISKDNAEEIIHLFELVSNRPVMDTEDELLAEDRKCFDKKILSVLGIEEYYDKIRNSLLSMQKTRLTVK